MGALKYGILVLMDSQTISPSQACRNVPISAHNDKPSLPIPIISTTHQALDLEVHCSAGIHRVLHFQSISGSSLNFAPKAHLQNRRLLVHQILLYLHLLRSWRPYRGLLVRLETTLLCDFGDFLENLENSQQSSRKYLAWVELARRAKPHTKSWSCCGSLQG